MVGYLPPGQSSADVHGNQGQELARVREDERGIRVFADAARDGNSDVARVRVHGQDDKSAGLCGSRKRAGLSARRSQGDVTRGAIDRDSPGIAGVFVLDAST